MQKSISENSEMKIFQIVLLNMNQKVIVKFDIQKSNK